MIEDQDYRDLQTIMQLLAGIVGRQERARAEREALRKKLTQIENVLYFPGAEPSGRSPDEGDDDMKKRKYGSGSLIRRSRFGAEGNLLKWWEGKYYDLNGKQHSVTAQTKAECEKRLAERIQEKRSSSPSMTKRTLTEWSKKPLREWMNFWFEKYKSAKKDEDGNYLPRRKPTTAENTRRFLDKNILPALGDLRICEITPMLAEDFIYSQKRSNARKKIFDVCHGAFAKLVAFGELPRNVFDIIEKPTHKNKTRRPFTLQEQNDLLAALSPEYAGAFFFLCCTSLRLGEFLALRKEDIDFSRHKIVVRNSDNRYGERTTPKTEKSLREIYFVSALFENFSLEWLGTYTRGGLTDHIRDAIQTLGLENVTLHSTRHTFASLCYAVKIPDKVTQNMLGHSSLKMTLDIYTDILGTGSSPIFDYIKNLRTLVDTLVLHG